MDREKREKAKDGGTTVNAEEGRPEYEYL